MHWFLLLLLTFPLASTADDNDDDNAEETTTLLPQETPSPTSIETDPDLEDENTETTTISTSVQTTLSPEESTLPFTPFIPNHKAISFDLDETFELAERYLNATSMENELKPLFTPVPTLEENHYHNKNMTFHKFGRKMTPKRAKELCFRMGEFMFGPRDLSDHKIIKQTGVDNIIVNVEQVSDADKAFIYSNGARVPMAYGNALLDINIANPRCVAYKIQPPSFSSVACNVKRSFFCGKKDNFDIQLQNAQRDREEASRFLSKLKDVVASNADLFRDLNDTKHRLSPTNHCKNAQQVTFMDLPIISATDFTERLVEMNSAIDSLRALFQRLREIKHLINDNDSFHPFLYEDNICLKRVKTRTTNRTTDHFPADEEDKDNNATGTHYNHKLFDIILGSLTGILTLIGILNFAYTVIKKQFCAEQEEEDLDAEEMMQFNPEPDTPSIRRVRFEDGRLNSSRTSSSSSSSELERRYITNY